MFPNKLLEAETDKVGDTLGNVEAKQLLDMVSDTIAVEDIETLCAYWSKGTGRHTLQEPKPKGLATHFARWTLTDWSTCWLY